MKIISLIFSVGLLSLGLTSETKNLKSIVQTQKSASGKLQNEIVKEFDENENLIKKTFKNFNGVATRTSFYQVDEKGRMISDSTYNSDNELVESCFYEYNEQDDIIIQKRLFVKRDAYYEEHYERTYDSNGNEIKIMQFNKDGELGWVYDYEYDENNNEIKSFSYFQGTIRNEWNKKYKKGKCVEAKLFDYENDELRRRDNTYYFYKYNKDGFKEKTTVHSVAEHLKEKQISISVYTYNDEGDVVEERYTKNGDLSSVKTMKNTYW